MQKTLLVYNIFSSGISSKLINGVLKTLEGKGFYVDKIGTSRIGEVSEKINNYLKDQSKNINMVIAVGGDGIINEAVNALAFTKIPLGIIPRGTGNAFAKDRKIPFKVKKAIEV